jgi:hypothetical protein
MLCVALSSHSCTAALRNPYSATCHSVTADPSAVPNCRNVSSAYCGSRTVSDRMVYKILQSFFESFHLFATCPLGFTFISILRCHSSIPVSISLSIHITTRLRIRYKATLFSNAFYVLRPYYICYSIITTM